MYMCIHFYEEVRNLFEWWFTRKFCICLLSRAARQLLQTYISSALSAIGAQPIINYYTSPDVTHIIIIEDKTRQP